MKFNVPSWRLRALAAACLCASGMAAAAPTSHDGVFTSDDERYVYHFSLTGAASLNAFTTSYGQGGFAPVLTLFGAAGGVQQNVGSTNVCATAGADFCWDAVFGATLQAGDYSLVLTQDYNTANGDTLADGFFFDGLADYTSQLYLGTDGGRCINVDGTQRSCSYALTIDLTLAAGADPGGEVPEPGSLALFGAALLGAAALRRRAV